MSLPAALPHLDFVTDPDVLASLSHDDAEWAPVGRPVAAVRPRSTEEVQAIVAECAAQGIPVVARGAGTGLSGGANAVDGCLVLDLSRMDRISRSTHLGLSATAEALLLAQIDTPGAAGDDEAAALATIFREAGAEWAEQSTDEFEAEALFAARRLA